MPIGNLQHSQCKCAALVQRRKFEFTALQGERCPCQERQCFLTRARGFGIHVGAAQVPGAQVPGFGSRGLGIYVGAAQVPGFGFKPYLGFGPVPGEKHACSQVRVRRSSGKAIASTTTKS